MKCYVWLSNGTTFSSPQEWFSYSGFDATKTTNRVVAGDFDADGKCDIGVMYDYGNDLSKMLVFKSSGRSFSLSEWYNSGTGNFRASLASGRFVSGDFNGDGKSDIATMYDYTNGTIGVFVFLSTGTAFNGSNWYSATFNASNVTNRFVAGDFDGDGKSDIGMMYDYGNDLSKIIVLKSSGQSFSSSIWYDSGAGNFKASSVSGKFVAGDFDGDGKCDIATIYDYDWGRTIDRNIYTFKSTGSSFDESSWLCQNFYQGDPAYFSANELVSGDYNGDKKADFVGMNEYETNSTYFKLWTSQETSFGSETNAWDSKVGVKSTLNTTTTLLKSIKNGSDNELSYTYDETGNITTISEGGVIKKIYTYDDLNQLVSESDIDLNKKTTYTYDNGGNITFKTMSSYSSPSTTLGTVRYTYDTKWKDQLKWYSGEAISYDKVGNPLDYYNGFKFAWKNGRELANATKGTDSLDFSYNGDGIRTSKTVNGIKTTYYLNGSKIVGEITGSSQTSYLQDENGNDYGFIYNGESYYYVRNGQNDVIKIITSTGEVVAKYSYNAWGKLLSIVDGAGNNITKDKSSIGYKNPIRYRGYYYDSETELYYLNSRYYDPETGRFVNADDTETLTATYMGVTDKNLYSYCDNNPIVRSDSSGYIWETICDVLGIGTSTYDLIKKPSWKNAGYLAWDVGAAFVPFVPGSYSGKAVKAATKVSKTGKASKVAKSVGKASKAISNMGEFFGSSFGKSIKKYTTKTSFLYDGQSIYRITEKTGNKYLKKGYGMYLDALHKDHLEVIDKTGKVKYVLNLDGTLNEGKTKEVAGRIIKGW